MNTIENHQIKGITIKNVIVTIASTASIVASVVTTYFGLKTDILQIKASQETESKITNIRVTVLESEVMLLQKEVTELMKPAAAAAKKQKEKSAQDPYLLSVVDDK